MICSEMILAYFQILIHIADAPCHGTMYHTGSGDHYPNGDPAGISYESMMQQVVRLDIQYTGLVISTSNTQTK